MLDTLDEKKKFGPATRLSKVFPEELPEETIPLIVRPPLTGPSASASASGLKRDFDTALLDAITTLDRKLDGRTPL
ncbi:hypothetical protein BGX26_006578 [Mortierella sp. AD094]|nr:hypothetical protein BGX26_006578 [Mortierella sp. AD094]